MFDMPSIQPSIVDYGAQCISRRLTLRSKRGKYNRTRGNRSGSTLKYPQLHLIRLKNMTQIHEWKISPEYGAIRPEEQKAYIASLTKK